MLVTHNWGVVGHGSPAVSTNICEFWAIGKLRYTALHSTAQHCTAYNSGSILLLDNLALLLLLLLATRFLV